MSKLSKAELLFIRACKSRNPEHRINRLYRMMYMGLLPVDEQQVLYILGIIHEKCYKYHHKGVVSLIYATSPQNRLMLGCTMDSSHNDVFKAVIISTLRDMAIVDIEGWIHPARFRNSKLIQRYVI